MVHLTILRGAKMDQKRRYSHYYMDESIHIGLAYNISDLVYNSVATVIRPSNEQTAAL